MSFYRSSPLAGIQKVDTGGVDLVQDVLLASVSSF